jgi:hypothetical protein
MQRLRLPKRIFGYLIVLAIGVTLTPAIVPVANAITCSDPPCGTCRDGRWDQQAMSCCGAAADCSSCTACAK